MGLLVHDRENGRAKVAGSADAEAIAAHVRALLSGACRGAVRRTPRVAALSLSAAGRAHARSRRVARAAGPTRGGRGADAFGDRIGAVSSRAAAVSPGDRLARAERRRLAGLSARSHLVPFYPARLVTRAAAASCKSRLPTWRPTRRARSPRINETKACAPSPARALRCASVAAGHRIGRPIRTTRPTRGSGRPARSWPFLRRCHIRRGRDAPR